MPTNLDPILARVDTSHHWICRPGQAPEHVELALPVELHGAPYARGACPIGRGESTTRLALLDLDSHKGETPWPTMTDVAGRVCDELDARGLRATAVRSSGGHGVHLYLLWRDPQDAYSVRETLREALAACGLKNGTGGVAQNEIEIFPKQDSVPADRAGSMFVLPFANKSVPLEPLAGFAPCADVTWRASEPVAKRERPAREASTAFGGAEYEQLKRELFAQNPDAGYDEWNRACAVAHHKCGGEDWGLDLVEEWCLTAKGLHGVASRDELESKWRSYGNHPDPATEFPRNVIADLADFDVVVPDTLATANNSTNVAITRERFSPEPWPQFALGAPLTWIVKGVLPAAELVVLFGESGSGKTFLVLDIVAAVARGVPWRQRKVKQGRVVYVCAEGARGFRKRIKAYAQQNAIPDFSSMPLGVIADVPNLLERDQALELARAIVAWGGASVIVIDTLSATSPGGDENSGEDMGAVLGHCKGLHRATGATVVLVHHSGKDASRGARGWSGLKGNVDAQLEVTQLGDARALSLEKMKDDKDDLTLAFKLNPIMVGLDEDDEPITSCVVEHVDSAPTVDARPRKLGSTEQIVLDVVRDAQSLAGNGAPQGAVIESAALRMPHDTSKRDKRREHATRALTSLIADGYIRIEDERIHVNS